MRILLLNHLGLGDFIQMNGLIHTLIESFQHFSLEEICLVACNNHSKPSLLHLYSDYPMVTFYWMDTTKSITEDPLFKLVDKQPAGSVISVDNKLYMTYTFGLHSPLIHWENWKKWEMCGLTWVESLYLVPLCINPLNRYTKFHLPSDLSRAIQKYENLLEILGTTDYILVHDDPSRDRIMRKEILCKILEQDSMKSLPVIYLGKKRYNYPLIDGLSNPDVSQILECDSIFDLVFILKHAKALHLMDSSMACLVDILNIQSKLYMHSYMLFDTGKTYHRHPWVRIEVQ